MSKNYNQLEIDKRNKTIESKKNEIFEDYRDNLLSYRELAKKYDLKLHDVFKLLNSDEFKERNKQVLNVRAINYMNQIDDEIDKIQDESSNSFVAKQRLKIDNLRYLARITSPKLFNENYQIALLRNEQDNSSNREIPEFKITLETNSQKITTIENK